MTKEAFAEQVVQLRSALYYVSYSLLPNPHDQEDAVQECIRKAFQKQESLRDEKYLKTWLIRILVNECHNIHRRRKREFPVEALPDTPPPEADREVFWSINRLDEKYRLPLVLHHYEGYTTKETAHILGIPEGTVKSRLLKARKLLGNYLQEKEVWA